MSRQEVWSTRGVPRKSEEPPHHGPNLARARAAEANVRGGFPAAVVPRGVTMPWGSAHADLLGRQANVCSRRGRAPSAVQEAPCLLKTETRRLQAGLAPSREGAGSLQETTGPERGGLPVSSDHSPLAWRAHLSADARTAHCSEPKTSVGRDAGWAVWLRPARAGSWAIRTPCGVNARSE